MTASSTIRCRDPRPLPVGVGNEMASAPIESFELSHNQLSIRHHFQGDTWRTWKEKIHNLDCRILLICRFVQHNKYHIMVCELNVSNFWGIFFLLCRTPTGATKAETAVVTGYNASQSHPQPLPSFKTHERVWQAAEKPLQSPWSRVVLVLPPAQSSSMLGADKQAMPASRRRPRLRHLAVAGDGGQRRQAVQEEDGRQRQRRSWSPPRRHRDTFKKVRKGMGSAPY